MSGVVAVVVACEGATDVLDIGGGGGGGGGRGGTGGLCGGGKRWTILLRYAQRVRIK